MLDIAKPEKDRLAIYSTTLFLSHQLKEIKNTKIELKRSNHLALNTQICKSSNVKCIKDPFS
jgi:hypothetical protein